MTEARRCLTCGEIFVGRIDKKFCTDQCRNSFNNSRKRLNEKRIIAVNSILRRNRKILRQFNPEGKTTIRREYLEKLNFNFKFHTHTFVTVNGNKYKFCYEYGYFEMEDGIKVLIVNEQSYMK
jgi:predicted nucleic acid-binding Zn ribbon protein